MLLFCIEESDALKHNVDFNHHADWLKITDKS